MSSENEKIVRFCAGVVVLTAIALAVVMTVLR
jgi:hypothetical protein